MLEVKNQQPKFLSLISFFQPFFKLKQMVSKIMGSLFIQAPRVFVQNNKKNQKKMKKCAINLFFDFNLHIFTLLVKKMPTFLKIYVPQSLHNIVLKGFGQQLSQSFLMTHFANNVKIMINPFSKKKIETDRNYQHHFNSNFQPKRRLYENSIQ